MSKVEYDVCVVGAGACGAMLAARLGRAGVRVCVIEAGPRWNPGRDFVNGERESRRLMFPSSTQSLGSAPLGTLAGMGLGGGTIVYRGASYRMSPSDFRLRTIEGIADDWPVTYEELAPYYQQAEWELRISGDHRSPWEPPREPYPNPPLAWNCNAEALRRGFEKLGIRYLATPYAANSKPADGNPACVYCGFCISGCPINAKNSTLVTHVPIAERHGVEFRTEAFASRIELGSNRRVDGVCYFDKHGVEHKVAARAAVVSAFAIETPRLLLNSACSSFPDGLANSSGFVGRYVQGHTSKMVYGRFAFRIDRFRGLGGIHTRDFYETDPANPYLRGFTIMATTGGTSSPLALANSRPALWGSELMKFMQSFRHTAAMSVMGTEIPNPENRVEIDRERKDLFGLPAARMTHEWGPNDLAVSDAGVAKARAIMEAAGGSDVYETALRSTHVMGSCRMGNDPLRSVVDQYCRTYDIPNLFVCDTSVMVTGGAVNPTLTAQAIALRTADFMIAAASRREL